MMLFLSFFLCGYAQPYLTASIVEKLIVKEKEQLLGCSSLVDGLYRVRFTVDKTGVVQQLSGESCFAVLQSFSFPAHPTSIRTFAWEVASKDGVLYPQRVTREKSSVILLPGIFAKEKQEILDLIQQEKELLLMHCFHQIL